MMQKQDRLSHRELAASNMRYFRVIRQPRDLFYKDEGGKANYLRCAFKLCFGAKFKGERKLAGRPLRVQPSLYYESGLRVEDSDQSILELIGINEFKGQLEPMYVDPKTLQIEVKYRLTKVSRRKDNQRFRLCISSCDDSYAVYDGLGAATQVLSKRKKQVLIDSGEIQVGSGSPRPHKRIRVLEEQIGQMQATMDQLLSLVKSQHQKISSMETQIMSPFSRRPSFTAAQLKLGDKSISCRRHSFTPDRRHSFTQDVQMFRNGLAAPPILGKLCGNVPVKSNGFHGSDIAQMDPIPGPGSMLRGLSDLIVEEFGMGKQPTRVH